MLPFVYVALCLWAPAKRCRALLCECDVGYGVTCDIGQGADKMPPLLMADKR